MEKSRIYQFLKSKENITESSLKLYLNNLKRLNGGEFPNNFNFLKNTEKILEHLEKYKPNTRRSYLITIITSLKHDPKQKKLYDKYYTHLDKYNKESAVNNGKSETQKKNWIDQDGIKEIYDNLNEEVKPLLSQKKINQTDYDKVLKFVIFSLFVLQKPRRNADYQKCIIVKKMPTEMDKDLNYLDITNKKWYFNNYKTKGKYETQEITATDEMIDVINSYLKFHPKKKEFKKKKSASIPLLVNYAGEPFANGNAITRILNKIFGRKIGVSMLRSIYLTDKYSDSMKEMKDDSEAMGTSTNTIQNQYVKTDGDNPTE